MNDPLFLLGNRRASAFDNLSRDVLGNAEAVRKAYAQAKPGRWVVVDSDAVTLLSSAFEAERPRHRVLLLGPTSAGRRERLRSLFGVVVAAEEGVRLLPDDELVEVLKDERAEDLFIGGVVDSDDKVLILYRGNLERLVVPFGWFKPSGKSRPDFTAFSVTDMGQTVQLGAYEAAADAIFYEFDADARRRLKERVIEKDPSFGGSLRRIRLLRGLSRGDFPGITAKTIARIERGEVEQPHADTLAVIAERLGVKPGELGSY